MAIVIHLGYCSKSEQTVALKVLKYASKIKLIVTRYWSCFQPLRPQNYPEIFAKKDNIGTLEEMWPFFL